MLLNRVGFAFGVALAAASWSAAAAAQEAASGDLMLLGTSDLRAAMSQRFDAALTVSQDPSTIGADSSRYMWASQAKAQCGIALGFLKSGIKDAVSVGKCVDAEMRMQGATAPAPLPQPLSPQPLAAPSDCSSPVAGMVFFDWDSAIPPESGSQILDSIASNMAGCRWSGLIVAGHTDRSGGDAYNDALSVRRANAIASALESKGISRNQLDVSGYGESEPKVPTIDGERNPTNRRVEITVK